MKQAKSEPASTVLDNGRNRKNLDALTKRVRAAISAAYHAHAEGPTTALRSYAENMSNPDDFAILLTDEAASEVRHRAFGARLLGRSPKRIITREHSALLLVLYAIGEGASGKKPKAEDCLVCKPTAFRAGLVGWLARKKLRRDRGLLQALAALDYGKAVA